MAVLRGEHANPFELQSFRPLLGSWDLFAVGAADGSHDLDSLQMPLVRLRHYGRGRLARRVLGDRSSRLLGLRKAVSGCAIVHSAETFLPISEQAAQLRSRQGFKLVLTCWENIPFLYEEGPILARRKSVVREAADLFLAVTERAREALLLEGVPEDRIVTQPVGVDRGFFRPSARDPAIRERWGVADDSNVVLYCGRLVREKGVLDLVRAVATVPEAVVVIAGSGPEQTRLDLAVRALGLDGRVRFVGPLPYGRMSEAYAAADVFCLPSVSTPYWQEQFGMVLVEAMASGVPIVTTSTGSIPEVVGPAAMLVPDYSPDALAEAIGALLGDPDRRHALGELGLQRVADRYDAQKVAAAIGSTYERLLA